jgi:hypothetical protein
MICPALVMHSESFFDAPVITNFPGAESVGLA